MATTTLAKGITSGYVPLGGIGPGNSPYMSSSAFAGNVLLIDLADLHQQGWLAAADLLPVPGLNGPAAPAATTGNAAGMRSATLRV